MQVTATRTDPHLLRRLFRGRRMVLLVEYGDPAIPVELTRAGIPCVGLARDPAPGEMCRRQGVAAWTGTWPVLDHYRERFDAIHLPLTAPAAGPEWTDPLRCLVRLGRSLLPGGLLALAVDREGPLKEIERAGAAAGFLPGTDPTGEGVAGMVLLGKPAAAVVPVGDYPEVVGPYADAFLDCAPVLVPGCGEGNFLAALADRETPGSGLESDPAMARRCRERGLEVIVSGPGLLAERPASYGGVYLGNLAEKLAPRSLERLIALAAHALRPGGRLLMRSANWGHEPVRRYIFRRNPANREPIPPSRLEDICRRQGLEPVEKGSLPEDRSNYFLLAERSEAGGPDPSLVADGSIAVDPATGDDPINGPPRSIHDLERFERKFTSQSGEDGVVAAIFAMVGVKDRFYVEFGCGDGLQCNTARLRRQGWRGLLMDGMAEPAAPDTRIHREWIDADNINALFAKHGVPREFDLLSIDLDGNDYWVWQALEYRPRVVICEYNANLGPTERLAIPYEPDHQWDGTDHYGASLTALDHLAREKGYTLLYCNRTGVNAFFLRDDLVPPGPRRPLAEIYRPPNYGHRGGRSPVNLARRMIDPRRRT